MTIVLTLVPVTRMPWITSGVAKRSVTVRFGGQDDAFRQKRELRCDDAARDLIARLDLGAEIAFGEFAGEVEGLRVDRLDVAGRIDVMDDARVDDRQHDRRDDRGHQGGPPQFRLEDILFRICPHGLPTIPRGRKTKAYIRNHAASSSPTVRSETARAPLGTSRMTRSSAASSTSSVLGGTREEKFGFGVSAMEALDPTPTNRDLSVKAGTDDALNTRAVKLCSFQQRGLAMLEGWFPIFRFYRTSGALLRQDVEA